MNCRFPRKTAQKRMFCFPWAGGGASFYTSLSSEITEDVEVLAFCLPGRENRFKDPSYKCLKDLLDDLVEMIRDKYSDKPFIFFGHSMGALISFFLAVELKLRHNIEPECMILSGTSAPNTPGLAEKRLKAKDLSKDSFMEKLHELGGTPPEILQNPELVDIFFPPMYADFCLIEEMFYNLPVDGKPPLDCPIDFFDGDQDGDHSIENWRKLTSGLLTYRQMPGGHFYLKEDENLKKLIFFINMKHGSDGDIV